MRSTKPHPIERHGAVARRTAAPREGGLRVTLGRKLDEKHLEALVHVAQVMRR